jgi:hypothetical protein
LTSKGGNYDLNRRKKEEGRRKKEEGRKLIEISI